MTAGEIPIRIARRLTAIQHPDTRPEPATVALLPTGCPPALGARVPRVCPKQQHRPEPAERARSTKEVAMIAEDLSHQVSAPSLNLRDSDTIRAKSNAYWLSLARDYSRPRSARLEPRWRLRRLPPYRACRPNICRYGPRGKPHATNDVAHINSAADVELVLSDEVDHSDRIIAGTDVIRIKDSASGAAQSTAQAG